MFDYNKFIREGKALIGNGNLLTISRHRINLNGTITIYADYISPGIQGAYQDYDKKGRCIHSQTGELYNDEGVEDIYLHNV